MDALLVLAINQANIAPLTRDPEARLRYGALETPAPDSERRPVSISSVAASLGLPFETVRRHVKLLCELGVCSAAPAGVIVPERFMVSSTYFASVTSAHARLQAFGAALDAAGLLDAPPPSSFPPEPGVPVRAAVRLLSDYILRASESLLRRLGEVMPTLVLLAVLSSHFAEGGAALRVAALAKRLQIPEETARRHAQRLIERGCCLRSPQGLILREAMLAEPAWRGLLSDNAANVQRLFAGLGERGVLDAWKRSGDSA